MWLFSIRHFIQKHNAFLAFGTCGLAGIFVDVDHAVNYFFVQESGGRFLHGWFCFISILVLCGLISYIGRLYHQFVLSKHNITTKRSK